MSTCTDRDPLHHHTSLVHHISLLPEDDESCSMRYKSGIVVSITLILEAFECVAFKVSFD
jgi:hypothetical protein